MESGLIYRVESHNPEMWSSADEEWLMVLWEEHEILYNTMLREYKQFDQKIAAIQKISEIMGQPVDLIERKMRSLRTQYRRYKNQESLRNGTVGKRAPYLLKRMRFLEPFLKPLKEGGGDMEGAEEDQMYQVEEGEDYAPADDYTDFENDGDESEVSTETKSTKRQFPKRCDKYGQSPPKQTRVQPELELLKGVLDAYRKVDVPVSTPYPRPSPSSPAQPDQDERYGNYLIGELRYLPSSAKNWMKMKINQLLFEAQSGTYMDPAPLKAHTHVVSHTIVSPVQTQPPSQTSCPAMPDTMRVLRRNHTTYSVDMVTVPRPVVSKPHDVLIKVSFAGICGTDLHILNGNLPGVPNDLILGHEICGTVFDVGEDVTGLVIGQRVVVNPMRCCGNCANCQKGEVRSCPNGSLAKEYGIFEEGGWAEFWVIPKSQAVPLPAEIPPAVGVLCEPISCVHQGWQNLGPLKENAAILVVGAGIIGQLWAALFHIKGYSDVTVCDVNPDRRSLVKTSFPSYCTCHPDAMADKHDTHDIIIDCTGNIQAIQAVLRLLRPNGILNIFGVCAPDDTLMLKPTDIVLKNQTIVGTLIDPFSLPKAITLVRDLAVKGYLDFARLGIQCYPFENYSLGISALKSRAITKAVLHLDRSVMHEQCKPEPSSYTVSTDERV